MEPSGCGRQKPSSRLAGPPTVPSGFSNQLIDSYRRNGRPSWEMVIC